MPAHAFERLAAGPRVKAWDGFLLAAGSLSRGSVEAVAAFSDAEWADLLTEGNLHWITPLAYRVLAANRDRIRVPPAVWRGFKKSYLVSRARTRRADALIIPVLLALEEAGISVIVLKGMHLSTQVYDDPAMRPMIDADLLLRRQHLSRASRIVESFGFRQRGAAMRSPNPESADFGKQHLAAFWYPDGPPIELHHDLWASHILRRVDMEEVWARARPARIGGANVLVLSPEDALLHLCLHAALMHGFAIKALGVCDVPVALRRWRDCLDWDVFWSRARAWGAERSAIITLALVQDRLGCPLPDGASRPLAAYRADLDGLMAVAEGEMRSKALALARRRPSGSATDAGGHSARNVLALLERMPSHRARLRLVASRIVIPREELSAWFGLSSEPPWLPLLHPVRIALVAVRQAVGISRIMIKRGLRRAKDPRTRLLNWLGEG